MDNLQPTILTICFPMTADKILLGKKKDNPNATHYIYGVGLFNGFGGHQEPGETILQTAARELKEEAGLLSDRIIKVGIVLVYFKDTQKMTELHFLTTTSFTGKSVETEEMIPTWFDKDNIPLDKMWSNDKYYMNEIIHGETFTGYFVLDNPENKNILSHRIIKVDTLPDHLDHVEFHRSINL